MSDSVLPTSLQWNLKVGDEPSEDAQAEAQRFLSFSKERAEAIRSLVKLPPDVIASVLLANIPVEDAMDLEKTNKTLQAFELVKGGFEHRRVKQHHQSVNFCNGSIHLPEEMLIHVLGFLDKRDLIYGASLVSYAWAKASLSPNVTRWQTIDFVYCKPASTPVEVEVPRLVYRPSKIATKEQLFQMLERPQFSFLRKLVVPIALTDSLLEEIAKAVPTLEEFGSKQRCILSSEMMRKLPVLFPALKVLTVLDMNNTEDVIDLVEAMGNRLVSLRIDVDYNLEEAGLTDNDFIFIARHCPNLRIFTYFSLRGYSSVRADQPHPFFVHSQMTERGLAALVSGCPRLEHLSLGGTCGSIFSGPDGIINVALNAKNLRFLNLSGCHDDLGLHLFMRRRIFSARLDRNADDREGLFRFRLLPLD